MLSRSTERFLDDLATRVARSMPPAEAAAFVEEARTHLEESIQARLELGESPESAEKTALAAFGTVSEVSRQIRRREPRFDRNFTICSLATVAVVASPCVVPDWVAHAMSWPLGILYVAYLVTSWRARRPQFWIFTMVILPLWLGMAFVSASHSVTITRSMGHPKTFSASRNGLERSMAAILEGVNRLEAAPSEWRAGYQRYLRGESNLAPDPFAQFDVAAPLILSPQLDRAVGEVRWKDAISMGTKLAADRVEWQLDLAEAVREAEGRTVLQELRYRLWSEDESVTIPPVLIVYGGGHLLFWSLGALGRRWRARRQPRIMA